MSEQNIVTLEVGSTMTKANAFVRTPNNTLSHVAQGFAPTTVLEGDVSLGVEAALAELERTSAFSVQNSEIFINSSAAGGLKMSVHGLTMSMTARAAKEASLGAGAIVRKLTAGPLHAFDLEEIREIHPNLILLAGGVDFGDTSTVLANAEKLLGLDLHIPLIYAGNTALQRPIRAMAEKANREIWVAENVFPSVDTLNVAPVRKLIHDAFSKHIIHAPGMQKLNRYTSETVIPTPGAVLLATELFANIAGDTVVFDVGGATTDVHSVTNGSKEFTDHLVDPEPREKRTVEGDLGVFVNARHVLALDTEGFWSNKEEYLRAMPNSEEEKALTRWLCEMAVVQGAKRHAGTLTDMFTASGKKTIVRGKDLTAVAWIVGTGGALTRVSGGENILAKIQTGPTTHLLPRAEARILLDKNYLFSALGTIAQKYPEMVQNTLKNIFFKGQTS
jgi:uncharacterized protein (TIGR01319 family)